MLVVVLSDTHISTRLTGIQGRVYEECAEADLIIHAGDIVETDVLIDLERFAPVRAVLGNMDGFDLRHLPEKLLIEIEGFRVGVVHGSGTPFGIEKRVFNLFNKDNPDILIFGHTHRFHHKEHKGVIMLNPGAACDRSFALMRLEKGREPKIKQIVF